MENAIELDGWALSADEHALAVINPGARISIPLYGRPALFAPHVRFKIYARPRFPSRHETFNRVFERESGARTILRAQTATQSLDQISGWETAIGWPKNRCHLMDID